MLKLYVKKHTVDFQLNRTFVPHPDPTETPSPDSTTHPGFSLITEPDNDRTTDSPSGQSTTTNDVISQSTSGQESSSPAPLKRPKLSGHMPGTVVSVSVAMLLVGVSIGATGIFVKSYGLPACLKGGS